VTPLNGQSILTAPPLTLSHMRTPIPPAGRGEASLTPDLFLVTTSGGGIFGLEVPVSEKFRTAFGQGHFLSIALSSAPLLWEMGLACRIR